MSVPPTHTTTCKYGLYERPVCLCKCRPHVHRRRQKPAGSTSRCELPYMGTGHQRRSQGRARLSVETVCKENKDQPRKKS